ncbi:hypothetical protein [Desulfotomaculum nigrificans]|uniref:hypothetical protein n=1 Tax=Desulfotomaculum nigrificans TaxID=1565 RepID=UPI0001FAEB22|nr:hypothetical protein [Desulfotomaculum nigrificans]
MKKTCDLVLILAVFTVLIVGSGIAIAAETNPGENHPVSTVGTQTTSPAGIQPVSPTEFAGKIDSVAKSAYKTAEPVVDTIASLIFSCTGIAAFFVLFAGMALFKRVIASLLTAGFGLLVYYGTPLIVGLIKGVALKIIN